MGMEGGTLRQKSRRQQWRERPDENTDSLQRAWRDVSKARMVFGLAIAPIPSTTTTWFAGSLVDNVSVTDLAILFGLTTGLAICWFIVAGSLFLFWLGTTFAVVERFNCLALCATLSFFMPLIGASIGFTLNPADIVHAVGIVFVCTLGGLILTPLGILGGWILWRIAIRPAAVPMHEMADVF